MTFFLLSCIFLVLSVVFLITGWLFTQGILDIPSEYFLFIPWIVGGICGYFLIYGSYLFWRDHRNQVDEDDTEMINEINDILIDIQTPTPPSNEHSALEKKLMGKIHPHPEEES